MQLNHLAVITEEMESAVGFFRDIMGLPVRGDQEYAEVDAGGITVSLMPGAPGAAGSLPNGVILQFEVAEVAATVDAMRERGARILREPHMTDWGTESAYAAAPSGLIVELYRWCSK